VSLEWTELAVTGSVPPPRCGHSATMIEKRLLIFGGRGGYYFLVSLWVPQRLRFMIHLKLQQTNMFLIPSHIQNVKLNFL